VPCLPPATYPSWISGCLISPVLCLRAALLIRILLTFLIQAAHSSSSLVYLDDPVVFLIWITRCFLIRGIRSSGLFAHLDNLVVFLIRATQPSGSLAYPDNPAVSLISCFARVTRLSGYLAYPGYPILGLSRFTWVI
jgi:hypothetical protein